MPGTLWYIVCNSCEKRWDVMAGALPDRAFLPALCLHCQEIVNGEQGTGDWRCTTCGMPSEPLPGAVLEPGRELPEHLVGVACPGCSSGALRAFECGLWD